LEIELVDYIFRANLNKTYSDNRQDRYLKLKNCPNLCQFFVDIVDAVAKQSFKVELNKNEPIFMGKHHPYEGDNNQYRVEVEKSISSLLHTYRIRYPKPQSLSDDQALVVPLIQMGVFNINYDRDFNIYLYSHLPLNSKLYLATSYFNMTKEYEKELIDNKRKDTTISLLTASPQANGFYGSRGISYYVPAGYTENEREFVERAENKCSNDGQIQILEYYRPQWTYHAKGLWLYEKDDTYPILTCVGSPNFGLNFLNYDSTLLLCLFL
jgi:CDP-diacylglycerol--glycerol-3-phosphate 3-phosphatidyltransferase